MTRPTFSSEKDLHDWFRSLLVAGEDGLASVISNADEIRKFEPANSEQRAIKGSFEYVLKSLCYTEIIADDENISTTVGEILRPDFLLYSADSENIVVVELKNLAGPTRQAGTEASAYSAEVRSYLPYISDGDVVTVLVSTVWPTLLRHYVAHEIIWIGRKIICLEPNDDASLAIIPIDQFASAQEPVQISGKEFGGYQLCLYDDELYGPNANRGRLDPYVNRMRTVLQAMAAQGNALRGHGFAFLWKDRWDQSLAPYSITMVNSAPFQGLGKILLQLKDGETPSEMQERFFRLVADQDPTGHGGTLSSIQAVASSMLKDVCSPRMEGFSTWDALEEIMRGRAELLAFSAWGFFGKRYFELLQSEYQSGASDLSHDDPNVGREMLNLVLDPDAPFVNLSHYFYDDEEEEQEEEPPSEIG
jgi:hypothetical protein